MAAATTKSHFHHQNDSSAPSAAGGGVHKQSRHPRPITEKERAALEEFLEKVHYSPRYPPALSVADNRYSDDDFEYRFVHGQ